MSAGPDRRLESLLDALPAAVAVLQGPEHVFTQANDRYLELIGRRSILGRPALEALPEIEDQGFVGLLDAVYTTGEAFHGDEMAVKIDRNGDGELDDAFVNLACLPMRDEAGAIEGVLAYAVEVTEMVAARLRLEALARDLELQRASLETVVERMPAGVAICDPDGNLTMTSTAFQEFFGVPIDDMDEVAAWKAFAGRRPDGSPYSPEEYPLARSLRTGETVLGEPIEFLSTGQPRTAEIFSAPILDDRGEIVSAVAVTVDVTERRAMRDELATRRALEEAQIRMEMVFDAAGDGIWVLDMNGRTTLINPAARRMTGWDPRDIVGKVSHHVIHHTRADGSPYPIEECPIYRSVNEGVRSSVDDEVFWRKDGTSFPVSYTTTPIFSGEEQIGAVQVFRDLTEGREAEAERRRVSGAADARRRAFEVNDTIVQRLAVADMAFSLGREEQGRAAMRQALDVSKRLINGWADEGGADLTRSAPADEGFDSS